MLLQALGQSVRLLGDAVFWRTAVKGVLLALPLAGLAAWVGIALVGALPEIRIGWLDALVHALGVVAAVLLALLLFPALASLLVGLFLDDVAAATERRFYPGDPPGSAVGVAESLRQGAALAGRMAGVNLLALPLYLLLLPAPPLVLLLYTAVNGWLLSREYFEMVAARHLDRPSRRALRRRSAGRVFAAGCLIALMFGVPVFNLAAPLIGTALMVHVFKGVAKGVGG